MVVYFPPPNYYQEGSHRVPFLEQLTCEKVKTLAHTSAP